MARYGVPPRRRYGKTRRRFLAAYSKPGDVEPVIANKVLKRLNSVTTFDGISTAINTYIGDRVLSARDEQRISNEREKLGIFRDLKQVTAIPGIGKKRFNVLIQALDNSI